MWSGSCRGTGYLLVALLLAARPAAAESSQLCTDWQAKFYRVPATWLSGAATRAEVERIFGPPTRVETQGSCSQLNYAATGCSCWFTVCSQGTVVSKTLTIGAAATPIFLDEDPAALTAAVASLQQALRDAEAQMTRVREAMEQVAPGPAPGPVVVPSAAPKPPPSAAAPARQCAAETKKGARCTRRASAGSDYCWQHQR